VNDCDDNRTTNVIISSTCINRTDCPLWVQPAPEEDEQDDEDGDVDDVSESDNDELDTDMIDERDSADDVIMLYISLLFSCTFYRNVNNSVMNFWNILKNTGIRAYLSILKY